MCTFLGWLQGLATANFFLFFDSLLIGLSKNNAVSNQIMLSKQCAELSDNCDCVLGSMIKMMNVALDDLDYFVAV